MALQEMVLYIQLHILLLVVLLFLQQKVSGRVVSTYAGITTTISSGVTATAGTITIANATNFDLNIGDYLLVDSEIVRVKTTVTSNSVIVFRGLLGTEQTAHDSGAVIRRIKPNPIELRRNLYSCFCSYV